MGVHRSVDKRLDLVDLGDVCRDRQCLAAVAVQLVGQGLEAVEAARAEHDGRVLLGEEPCSGLAEPAAGAGDDHDLAFDVGAHEAGIPFNRLDIRV